MSKNLTGVLTGTVFAFVSSFSYAEVYQCQVNGKLVFQQTPCPLEVAETGCDENYDYLEKSYAADASFEDTYCFYLQLDKLDTKEKQRLMKIYKQKRAQAELLAKKKAVSEKIAATSAAQEASDEPVKSPLQQDTQKF
jgi:uncharacterized pyridoxamine 5'-phosphate oxidase family protein